MKLKRVISLFGNRLRGTLIIAVITAVLVSLMPTSSAPVDAWFIPEPRHVDGNWNIGWDGSHINQTIYAFAAVRHALGTGDPIWNELRTHMHEVIRGNIWSDDYAQEWARENLSERAATWNQLRKAALDGLGYVPDWLDSLIDKASPDNLDDPAFFPDWVPGIGGFIFGVWHPDFSLHHLYKPDAWLENLLYSEADDWVRSNLRWNKGDNAVSRAAFWYQKAIEMYDLHGAEEFRDPYSIDVPLDTAYDHVEDEDYETTSGKVGGVRLVTAYDYLGRALHYVQDMTCPAHWQDTALHLYKLGLYENWSGNVPSGGDWTLWSEGATGSDFAKEAHGSINSTMHEWKTLGGGIFPPVLAERLRDEDRLLVRETPNMLGNAIAIGGGMLVRFQTQVGVPGLPPFEYDLTMMRVVGEGWTYPPVGVHRYESGAEVTLMAFPAEGWQFAGWTGDVTSPHHIELAVMTEDREITAVFEPASGKFRVGDAVRTTAALNVRDEPGLLTNVLRTQPGDTGGIILSAEYPYPRYLDGYTWWRVQYDDGTIGWSADHRLEVYTCPTPRFGAGDYVATTDELYVRDEPRLTDEYGNYFLDNVIATHPAGMRGKVRDFEEPRPRRVMGYDLWEIEWENGTIGWSSDHRLAPVEVAHSIDVFMLVDLSGSFSDDLPYFKVQAPDLMATLKSSHADVRFGLGKYEDYPISPFGSAWYGDKAYERLIRLTHNTDDVLSIIDGLYTRSGGDWPQSQLVALYQAATGEGQDLSEYGYPEASIPAGQEANFRSKAIKLFILWTDAPFHYPGDEGDIPYPGPSFDETVDAILALDPPMVIGISSGGGGLADLRAIASATNAVAPPEGVDTNGDGVIDIPEGEPLVAPIGYSGQGITAAIESLTTAAVMLPIASAGGPYTGKVGETIVFDGSGSFDPDGWIVQYEWDFDSDGTFDFSSAEPTAEYAYPAAFSGIATLRVTDDAGNTAIGTAPVEITLIPSTYKFEYSVPDPIVVATDVDIDVTFMTDEEGDIGYDGVRFRFEADGPGDVTFTATDSEGVEHTSTNSGFWGPESGFDLPALYEATTTWTLNFLRRAGDYTITFSLIEAPDGEVIADISETVTITVKPLPAAVIIDPETLNLQAPGQWITAYIELPEDYVAEDVDIETVKLVYGDEEPLVADWGAVQDSVFMGKFDWATVAGWFEGLHDEEVELTVAGEVDGVDFEGTDTIRVIDPPRPPRRGR